jgi:hypothetical protein
MGKNPMRQFIAFAAMLLIVTAASNARADDATKLYQALLSKQMERLPEGLSSASLGPSKLNPASQQAGMVGIAKITLTGKSSSGDVRYAVFSSLENYEAYAREFSLPGQPIFFPYFPEAKCTSHNDTQGCRIGNGTVLIVALTHGVVEGPHGTSAGMLVKAALEHLRSVRQSIGQPEPPPER